MNFTEEETIDLTLYLNIDDLRPSSRTTVTFKMISSKMWYLIRAAVKNVRINLGQLRIKRQIDSQLCESKINENMPSKKVNFAERDD